MRSAWCLIAVACGRVGFDAAEPVDVELVITPIAWADADAACRMRGAHLATIEDATENARFAALAATIPFDPSITNTNQRQRMWLGGTDLDESSWRWVTGEPFEYMNWRAGEPGSPGTEHCLILLGSEDGLWDNRPCDLVIDGYSCEQD